MDQIVYRLDLGLELRVQCPVVRRDGVGYGLGVGSRDFSLLVGEGRLQEQDIL